MFFLLPFAFFWTWLLLIQIYLFENLANGKVYVLSSKSSVY